ncbi:UPF0271 protein [Stella humosa]|uniref:5-oxoprolinase subunit A n=1 Tax=Stella humosa TaxID=94 RepID=A0A3N1MKE4_9PROT|nr:5-oxoprolinase subunit PxpA [Stella humosa]ROQ01446.1 UPF0271 protein [Stella humosa]BBK31822.1 UPF0271 protein [Stella humosa]
MAKTVDINSDMGESFGAYRIGNDQAMLSIVTSANVACGFHGGDPLVMHETVSTAKANGVDVGAHPGFFDLWGFGRRRIVGERPADLEKMIVYQLGAIQAMAHVTGHRVTHVKPHGAMSNMACVDAAMADAIARAVRAVDPGLVLMAMPNTELERAGERARLPIAREIFADRAYDDDANLVGRNLPGAVLHDADECARRILDFIEDGAIRSVSGKRIPAAIDTVSVHSDTEGAVAMARMLRQKLEAAGVVVRPLSQFIG